MKQTSISSALAKRVHFVCGKGGVGKSLYSCLLARHFCEHAQRTLLVQINAEDKHSRFLDITNVTDEIQQVGPFLSVVNVTPEASLEEYLILKLKSKTAYNIFFSNPIMQAFLRFIPGLAELNMLGKVYHHAQQAENGVPVYDRIVVDCPAAGHGYRFLQIAKVVHEGVRKGPIAEESKDMMRVLYDPNISILHIITLLEELPVQETVEFVASMQKAKTVRPGLLCINQYQQPELTPSLFNELEQAKAKLGDSFAPYHKLAAVATETWDEQNMWLKRLEKEIANLPHIILPKVVQAKSEFDKLNRLVMLTKDIF